LPGYQVAKLLGVVIGGVQPMIRRLIDQIHQFTDAIRVSPEWIEAMAFIDFQQYRLSQHLRITDYKVFCSQ
jgi:hypothetical protein